MEVRFQTCPVAQKTGDVPRQRHGQVFEIVDIHVFQLCAGVFWPCPD